MKAKDHKKHTGIVVKACTSILPRKWKGRSWYAEANNEEMDKPKGRTEIESAEKIQNGRTNCETTAKEKEKYFVVQAEN